MFLAGILFQNSSGIIIISMSLVAALKVIIKRSGYKMSYSLSAEAQQIQILGIITPYRGFVSSGGAHYMWYRFLFSIARELKTYYPIILSLDVGYVKAHYIPISLWKRYNQYVDLSTLKV